MMTRHLQRDGTGLKEHDESIYSKSSKENKEVETRVKRCTVFESESSSSSTSSLAARFSCNDTDSCLVSILGT